MIKTFPKIFFCMITLFCLAGCASHMSKQACLNTNWSQVGYGDAMNDTLPRNLNKSVNDCMRYNIAINTQSYQRGWNQGAKAWCTTDRAKELGVSGKVYKNICPASKKLAFSKAWHKGLKSYCIPSNGFQLGVSGKSYAGFCAASQNTAFQKSYNKGYNFYRTRHNLQGEIGNIDAQIAQQNTNIQRYQKSIEDALYNVAGSYRNNNNKQQNHLGQDIAMGTVVANDRLQISNAKREIRKLRARKITLRQQLIRINQEISQAQV